MSLQKAIPYLLSGAVILLSLYFYNMESPSERVLKILEELSSQLSIRPNETPLEKLQLVNEVVKKFDESFTVQVTVDDRQLFPMTNGDELKKNLLLVRKLIRQMRVQFVNLEVEEEGDMVNVKGKVTINSHQDTAQESPIEFKFAKKRTDWLIIYVKTTKSFNSFGKWRH